MTERTNLRTIGNADARTEKTLGPIVTSRPIFVSCENQTVVGSISVAPFAIAAARKRCCRIASATASSARELTPDSSSGSASIYAQPKPFARAKPTMSVR